MEKINASFLLFFCINCGAIARTPAKVPDSASNSAAAVVSKLYRDYAWETIFANSPFTELVDQPKTVIQQYFSSKLTELIFENKVCVEKTGDACNLDFDPIFASQDRASVHDLTVDNGTAADDVRVLFGTSSLAPLTELHFKMIKTSKGWRIDDIIYGKDRSNLKTILGNQ